MEKKLIKIKKSGGKFLPRAKVFVMMSGGVDSSVAAYLLKKQNKYEVIGAFIKGYNVDGCQDKEAEDARRVAKHLDIPFYVIDLEKEYKERIVNYLIEGYRKGITPNPDVMCNKEIKFGLFLKKAVALGADFVATGHYAQIEKVENKKLKIGINLNSKTRNLKDKGNFIYFIRQAIDDNKDQSYFLWALDQNQLKYCLFPIGKYTKPQIREIARKAKLPNYNKKDSQGVCFLGKFSFRDFLKTHLPTKKGDIINVDDEKIGEHEGAWFYTIGQRHLGVDQNFKNKTSDSKPYYVINKDIKNNRLIVAEDGGGLALYKKEVSLKSCQFADEEKLFSDVGEIEILTRVRYRQLLFKAKLTKEKNNYKLMFIEPQKFVAIGQSAVLYDEHGVVLGGGIIVK